MLKKFLLLLLYFCVYGVVSDTSFIDKGERAELFELTDNEVAVFKITLPDNEYTLLKEKAIYAKDDEHFDNVKLYSEFTKSIKAFMEILPTINFNKLYPDHDLNKVLPELEVDEKGFSKINTQQVMDQLDLNVNHYDPEASDFFEQVLKSNPNFNLYRVIMALADLQIKDGVKVSEDFTSLIDMVKNGFSTTTTTTTTTLERRDGGAPEAAAQFKTKNATMIAELNGKQKKFNKVTFSIGGSFSRQFSKLGYNIKIRGGKDLYGRSHFKIRPDVNDPTFLRTKIASDIHNRLGLKTVSSNYVKLYINNENMGLYILSDAYKPSWIEFVYGEKDTQSLYKCDMLFDFTVREAEGCTNEDDEVTDTSDLIEFLTAVENAKSASDLEGIFDIDLFISEMILEYLFGSWDHIQNPFMGHNFYLYKTKKGIWKYLSFDFDHDLGVPYKNVNSPFKNYTKNMHIIDILILKDSARFEKILNDIIRKAFNPSALYPHIDEVMKFIKPFVDEDKHPDPNGKYPGRINDANPNLYTIEQWEANCEFTTLKNSVESFIYYGLKYWILLQYRYVCNYYSLECDATYLDKNYKFSVNTNFQYSYVCGFDQMECEPLYKPQNDDDSTNNDNDYTTSINTTIPEEEETKTSEIPNESSNTTATVTKVTTILTTKTEAATTTADAEPTTQTDPSDEAEPTSESTYIIKCWAELVNYPCCPDEVTDVYDHDDYGDWGYDFTKKEWCGLTPYEWEGEDDCWSEKLGYSCCKGCKVYDVDSDGSWGYELDHWCGIPSSCQN